MTWFLRWLVCAPLVLVATFLWWSLIPWAIAASPWVVLGVFVYRLLVPAR